jgi:hypothetical protein
MKKANCFLYGQQIKDLAKKGESMLKDVPHLPKDWVKNIIKILPYLILIGGIFSLISGLQSLFSFGRNQAWVMHWLKINRAYYYVTGGFSIILAVLYLMAYKPVKNKEYEGWLLLFWTLIVTLIQSIILLIMGWGVVGPVIATLIGFYLIYEIRPEFIAKETKKTK